MLRIYVAPNGYTYQYEEGTQPPGYRLARGQGRRPANKENKEPKRK